MKNYEKEIRKLLDDDMYGENSRKRVVDGFLSLIQEERQGAVVQFVDWLDIGADDVDRKDLKGWVNDLMKYYFKSLEDKDKESNVK